MIDEISILPGRVRFRSNKVYSNKLLAKYISYYVEGLYGVKYSNINPTTGSILIVYDVKKTNNHLLSENIEVAIASGDIADKEKMQQHEVYYGTISKRDKSKRNFLCFGMLYLFIKIKNFTYGKFSISGNVAVLEVASAVTLIGGYPLLKQLYKRFSINIPTDADILLNLTAISFTILRESSKGIFVLVLKYLSDYIKYSAEVECLHTLNSGMGKTPEMTWMRSNNNQEVLVPVKALKIGDIIYIHKGEVSPVQGKIMMGSAVLNSLYHMGQPIVTHVVSGNSIHEGATVISGNLKIKVQNMPVSVTKKDLSLDKLNIYKKVGAYQNKITKIAMVVAGLNYIMTGSMLNVLSVLLVLTPSATATALSDGIKNYVAALKSNNIFLRNPNTFENIANSNTIMFDKTGTLTYGSMRVIKMESFDDAYSSDELLRICAACEVDNYHPISITLQDYVGENYDVSKVKSSVLIPSLGIEAIYDNHSLLIGNIKLFEMKNIDVTNGITDYKNYERQFYFPIFVAIDNELTGIIVMEDHIRSNATLLIAKLKYKGIEDVCLLTGDTYDKSCNTSKVLGIEKVYAECSSEDKLSIVNEAGKLRTVMMVGDGINDFEAMNAADVSISFANSACDKIQLNSDCIIFEENIDQLADLIYMSQKSHKLISQSITYSQIYNTIFGALAFFQCFDAFTAKSLNTINSLIVLLLNERIRWIAPDKMFDYELKRNSSLKSS